MQQIQIYGGDITQITMNDASQIISHNNQIGVVASGLMIVLPYLTYNIIKGGAGSFVHLAGQILGSSQGAASSASAEVVSGNRSLDNKTMSNGQWMNNNGFKTDLNSSFRMGHQEHQASDGSISKTTASGDQIFQAGPGITTSTGSRTMNLNDNMSAGTHESLSYEKSLMDSKQKEYSRTEQSAQRQATDLVARIASGEASGEHYNYGDTSSSGKTLNNLIETTKELHERNGYSWQQASEAAVHGGASFSWGNKGGSSSTSNDVSSIMNTENKQPKGALDYMREGAVNPLNYIPKFHLDAGGSTKFTTTDQSEQGLTEQTGASIRKSVVENVESVAKAAKEIQYNTNQSDEKSLSDSLSGSYEKMNNLRDSISVSEQNIDRYQRTSDISNVKSFNSSDEMYHKELQYISNLSNRYGSKFGMSGAQRIMERGGGDYDNYHQGFINREIGQMQKMKTNNFHYQDRTNEHITQNIDKSDYNQVSNIGQVEMKQKETVNQDAQNIVNTEHKISTKPFDLAIDQIHSKGDELQAKTNDAAKDRVLRKHLGKKKDENAKFNG